MSTAGTAKWARVGRLHPLYRGVYAHGHAALSEKGQWTAAMLAAGGAPLYPGSPAAGCWP